MLLQSLSPSGIQRIFQCLKVPKFQAPFGDNFSALKASCFGTFTQLSEPPNIHWNSSMIFCQFSETFLPGNFRFLFYVGTQALQASKDLQDLKAPKFLCANSSSVYQYFWETFLPTSLFQNCPGPKPSRIVQKLFCQTRYSNIPVIQIQFQTFLPISCYVT